jgi:hypothetical protein
MTGVIEIRTTTTREVRQVITIESKTAMIRISNRFFWRLNIAEGDGA